MEWDPCPLEPMLIQGEHLVKARTQTEISLRREDVVDVDVFAAEFGVDLHGLVGPSEIDTDLAAERTEKNPVYYVQYAHARIAGILRNAGNAQLSAQPSGELAVEERDLVKRLAEFPDVVEEATERRGPHAIPTYAIRVADEFHRFYHRHRVLDSEEEGFRLGLCRATQAVVARSLELIGVEAPERM